ncbi:MAG: dihydroorotate dehydrogenase electron transfer subunit [Treponema sp.]|nr:dihydroorotate dehydrogenase electron transfer subunit [Treponema sp.]
MTCKQCELVYNYSVNDEYFILGFVWENPIPKAGQFFMLKPLRTSVFLPRPIGIFEYIPEKKIVKFLISRRGRGTIELSLLNIGEKVQLTGPLGNCWADFLPENGLEKGKAALVGGSAGVAPLAALVAERSDYNFHFYAGFRQGFREKEEEDAILGAGIKAKKVIITAEDGRNALIGLITDFIIDLESFDFVFGCGPMPMLHALMKKCEIKNIPCFLSLESRMACGVGACYGCSVHTTGGNRRCCKEGPIFPSKEVIFNV